MSNEKPRHWTEGSNLRSQLAENEILAMGSEVQITPEIASAVIKPMMDILDSAAAEADEIYAKQH